MNLRHRCHNRSAARWSRVVIGLVILAFVQSAMATLGGAPDSVQSDRIQLRGQVQIRSAENFQVHEIRAETGVSVREYVAGGAVFGIAWNGPVIPDLRQLLGEHYPAYIETLRAQRARQKGRGPVLVQLPGLVVEMSGHMRAFQGRAYLTEQLPQGVQAEAVR